MMIETFDFNCFQHTIGQIKTNAHLEKKKLCEYLKAEFEQQSITIEACGFVTESSMLKERFLLGQS